MPDVAPIGTHEDPTLGMHTRITDAIEWTSVAPVAGAASRYRLAGRIMYTPETLGRTVIELNAQAPGGRGPTGSTARQAYAHIVAKEPRLAIAVSRLRPGTAARLAEALAPAQVELRAEGASPPFTRQATPLPVRVGVSGY